MLFKDIIGHDKLKKELVESVDKGRVPHSQLFVGDSGYGSLALAMAYAQYLNCSDRRGGDACGVCSSCFKYNNLQHPDLHFIYPINKSPHATFQGNASDLISEHLIGQWRDIFNTSSPRAYFTLEQWYQKLELSKNSQGNISRGEANSLIKKLGYKSFEDGYKVVIIWLAEFMNDAAANALLKLFEEPSEDTVFIFITHNRDAIMKTILSRTQSVFVRPVERDAIVEYLTTINAGATKQENENIAHLCEGDICNIPSIMENIKSGEVSGDFNLFVSLMRLCFAVNHLGLLEWVEEVALLSREQQKSFLTYSIAMIRDSYITSLGLESVLSLYPYERDFIKKFHPYIHKDNIEILIGEFERCHVQLLRNGSPKIIFTHFTLAISKLIR